MRTKFSNRLMMISLGIVSMNTAYAQTEKPNVLWILTDDHRYDAVRPFNKMLTGNEMSPLENETDIMTFMRKSYQAHRLFPVGNYTNEDWQRLL